ncbi:MAG: AmmeMemoRadiSam system radical SAM enzyme [Promethearchaeia archaeon]
MGVNLQNFDKRIVHEGILQKPAKRGSQCLTCGHQCIIQEGKLGFCKTRINSNGSIYTLVYGNVSSISNNPIEKKPIYHFAPGTRALTVGSWGCNATCGFCQNSDISKTAPTPDNANFMSPMSFVEEARRRGSQGTSVSLNEATTLMLEWNIEMFEEAKEEGLYNTIVTNGYMSKKAIELMVDAGLDAANIDIKGCQEGVKRECGIDVELVWQNAVRMKEKGVHVELTTLMVPGLSDNVSCIESIAERINDDLGPSTPWHISRYFPAFEYSAPPTEIEDLFAAKQIGEDKGLHYVYVGNVYSKNLQNTVCPSCGSLCYERFSMISINKGLTEDGCCASCGADLNFSGLHGKWQQI